MLFNYFAKITDIGTSIIDLYLHIVCIKFTLLNLYVDIKIRISKMLVASCFVFQIYYYIKKQLKIMTKMFG